MQRKSDLPVWGSCTSRENVSIGRRGGLRRGGLLFGLFGMLGLIGLGLAGCGDKSKDAKEKEIPYSAADDRPVLHVMTTKVGAKNIFIPSTLVVTLGSGRVLTIYNDTELPHNFTIPGLEIDVVLSPGEETQVVLPPLKEPAIYDIRCSLHPPHRHASLVVLDIAK